MADRFVDSAGWISFSQGCWWASRSVSPPTPCHCIFRSCLQPTLEAVSELLAITRGGSWAELLSRPMRVALVVGVGLAIFQQVTGINTVIYYAPTIMQLAGIPTASGAILATVGIGSVNVLMTVLAMLLLDRVGRRPLLVGGMAFLMLYVGAFAISLGPIFWLLISEI